MSPYAYVLPLVIWVGTLIVCLLCTYVAWRALFGDRGRGKRRCPKCWYDLAYSPGMTCGECGHTAQSEREFTHTRRRPGIAFAAIFICVALVLGVNDQMNQRGMLRYVPTGLLIWSLPISGGMDGYIGREIDRRATSRQLTQDQWEKLVARCASGDWLNTPPSDSWIDNYGGFIENWRNRFIGDAKIEASLMTIPPRLEARSRDNWPAETPLVVAVRLEDWWPAGMECRIRATPRAAALSAAAPAVKQGEGADVSPSAPAMQPLTFYRGGETRFRPSPFTMYLPPLPEGEHEIVIDFKVDRRRMDGLLSKPAPDQESIAGESTAAGDEGWEAVGTFTASFKTRIAGALSALTSPISSDAMTSALAQVFGNAVRWEGGGRSPVRFGINAPMTFVSDFNDTAVGVSVELVRDNEVARRLNLWWIAGDNIADGDRNYGFEINHENLELLRLLADDTIQQGQWTLRVKSDPALALRAGKAKQFWQGEFATEINLRTSQSQAPPRMWWTENDAVETPQPDAPPPRRRGRSSL